MLRLLRLGGRDFRAFLVGSGGSARQGRNKTPANVASSGGRLIRPPMDAPHGEQTRTGARAPRGIAQDRGV